MPFESHFPRTFTRDSIARHAPSAPGIFAISSASEWILIAEATDIQDSLLRYAQQPGAELSSRRPTGFVFEVCPDAVRQSRLRRLVEEYRPVFRHSGVTS